jgi:hypothetical protein
VLGDTLSRGSGRGMDGVSYERTVTELLAARKRWQSAAFDVESAAMRHGKGSVEHCHALLLCQAAMTQWQECRTRERSAGRWPR